MFILFTIGIVVFVIKLTMLAFKAAMGIAKGLLFVLTLPLILMIMFIEGLVNIAMPLLLIGLIVVFAGPLFRR
ncbi:MAG: hypothetical protein ACI4WM_01420 [Erysipelotrichaceae bacterium]